MQKKINLILCLSLMLTILSGCSIIDILVQSVSTKTSILLEVAKVYSDYVIAYPIGVVMRSIAPSEPIIIPHEQEGIYTMEYGFVPDILIYPDDSEDSVSGKLYGVNNNYLDVSAIRNFDDTALQVGDQLTVTFDEGDMNLENNTIIAKSIEVKSVNDLDFNDLDFTDYRWYSYEAYGDGMKCDDMSTYSLISKLMDHGTVTCKEGPNELVYFKGYETNLTFLFDDGNYADFSVYQYATSEEMEIDAANMWNEEYCGRALPTSVYHYKLGKIIFSVTQKLDTVNYNSNRLMLILDKIAGRAFAKNVYDHYSSEEYEKAYENYRFGRE